MLNAKSEVDNMIVRVGFLDKDENYIARLANYYSAHANETVQFEIYLFTKEEALRKQLIFCAAR